MVSIDYQFKEIYITNITAFCKAMIEFPCGCFDQEKLF